MMMLTDTQIAARVTRNPQILRGEPIIRGTRVPVYLNVNNGVTPTQIVEDYPDFTLEDVEAAVAFAAQEQARTELRRGSPSWSGSCSTPTARPGSRASPTATKQSNKSCY